MKNEMINHEAEIAINVRSSSKFTAGVFESCPRLRLVSVWGTGTDNVDLAAASKARILVTNVPDYCIDEVSDHALALLLLMLASTTATTLVPGCFWIAR